MTTFDTLAPTYDDDFTHQPIGKILRARVHQRLSEHFSSGQHLLEIGCGTGEDALLLGKRGITITATDASETMREITSAKTESLDTVTVKVLNLTNLPDWGVQSFNGVFSNFGALNCIDDWQPLAQWLADKVPVGGKVCFGIMAKYCAWEFVWHILHGKWDIAMRRLRGDDFGALQITYPTVKRITQDFAPYFKRVHVSPLGLFLPTSALFDVVQKRPQLMNALVSLEERFQNVSQFSQFADHYWIEFERV